MGAHCANADDASPNTKSTTRNERGRKVFWSSIFMKTSRHRTLGERNCDSSSVHASGSRRKRHPPNGATAQASFGIDSGKLRSISATLWPSKATIVNNRRHENWVEQNS